MIWFVFNSCVYVEEISIQMNTLTFELNSWHATACVFLLCWWDWMVDFRPLAQCSQALFGKSAIQYKCPGKSDSNLLDLIVQVCKEWGTRKKRTCVFFFPFWPTEERETSVGWFDVNFTVCWIVRVFRSRDFFLFPSRIGWSVIPVLLVSS